MKEYNLFISHSWSYDNQYKALENLLNQRSYFRYKNYSVPKDDPIHNARHDFQLANAIENQMKLCSVILIMAGVYSSYSKWIKKEIDIAKSLGRPIIAIKPYGAERISTEVRNAATMEVAWRTDSIVDAIRSLA